MTTASDKALVPWARNRFLQAFAVAWALVWLVAAIAPFDRFDWLLENMLVVVAGALLAWRGRRDPLSDLSWLLIATFMMLHAVGAHYTYSEAPPGFWLRDALSLERNHFDRLVHFGFGLLLAYPLREYLARHAGVAGRHDGLLAFTLIATASALYEVLEWLVAAVVSPEAAMAYLGTQGDVFDAQKDTALAVAGAAIALVATRRHFAARLVARP
jgi:putative membrane protein